MSLRGSLGANHFAWVDRWIRTCRQFARAVSLAREEHSAPTRQFPAGPPAGATHRDRRRGVLRFLVVAAAIAFVATATFSAGAAAVEHGAETAPVSLRITARAVENDRVEFGVQMRQGDAWGDRVLPERRLFPRSTAVGRWLVSSPVAVAGVTVRIAAARGTDGRIEFALQHAGGGDWSPRILPARRFFPTTATVGRWLVSAAVTVGEGPVAQECYETRLNDEGVTVTTDCGEGPQLDRCLSLLPTLDPRPNVVFCRGSDDAPRIYRFFGCRFTDMEGFVWVDRSNWLYPRHVTSPIRIDVGTRVEFHSICDTGTLSNVFKIIDPDYPIDHVRACYVQVLQGEHNNLSDRREGHVQTYVMRLSDGTVRFQDATAGVGALANPCN